MSEENTRERVFEVIREKVKKILPSWEDLEYPYEYLNAYKYYIVKPEEYEAIPEGINLKVEGIIEEKPVIKHTKTNVLLFRYFVETYLTVSGIKIKHKGPAFIRKGEKVTIWGRKQTPRFDANRIETDDVIIQVMHWL
jgi:hypothetical protein